MADSRKAFLADGVYLSIPASAVDKFEASRMRFHRAMVPWPTPQIIPQWGQWLDL